MQTIAEQKFEKLNKQLDELILQFSTKIEEFLEIIKEKDKEIENLRKLIDGAVLNLCITKGQSISTLSMN